MKKRLLTYLAFVVGLTLAGGLLGWVGFAAATAPSPSVVGAAVAFALSILCAALFEGERWLTE